MSFKSAIEVWERVPRVEEDMEVDDASRAVFAAAREEIAVLREAATCARDWLDHVWPCAQDGKLITKLNAALERTE